MAHTYENLELARHEWLNADKEMKLRAFVLAECLVKFGTLDSESVVIAEYKAARAIEQGAWDRYMAISHADEEVSA